VTLVQSIFGGGLGSKGAGLFRASQRANASCRWVYDTTDADLGLLTPAITAPTNYRVRTVASIGPGADSGTIAFFGDENPDDLKVSATAAREWRVDFRSDFEESNPGDVVAGQIYLVELAVTGTAYELFIDGVSTLTGSAGTAPTLLDLAIGGRRNGSAVDQKIRGQVCAFQIDDLDTPANTKTWNFLRRQCWTPINNVINDQNDLNPLTQVNPPVSDNWSNTLLTAQEL